MVRQITRKNVPAPLKHMKQNGVIIEDSTELSVTLWELHLQTSALVITLLQIKKKHQLLAKRKPINFTSDNTEFYYMPFTKSELVDALHKAHDSATGPDNQMLKRLPDSASSVLLQIFNNLWISGNFPKSWCEATVIPFLNPAKIQWNSTVSTNSYNEQSLQDVERMVNDRLVYYRELNGIINIYQSGFRKHRGTVDQLVCFESFLRDVRQRRARCCHLL